MPTIPDEMVFMLGDTLEVKNEDDVSHQLGPDLGSAGFNRQVGAGTGTKAGLFLFIPTRAVFWAGCTPADNTLSTRITGVGLVTPATTALLFVYSLLIFPVKQTGAGEQGTGMIFSGCSAAAGLFTTLLVLAGMGFMARLGIWQLDRLEIRRAFNHRVTTQLSQPELYLDPIALADESLPGQLEKMEYRSARVRGDLRSFTTRSPCAASITGTNMAFT